MKLIIGLVTAALLAGCATTTQRNTPSGRPEVVLPNASVSATKAAIISRMVNRGFTLRNEGASQLTFEKRGDTGTGGLIEARFGFVANFTVIDQSPGVRVIAEASSKQDIGTAFERPTAIVSAQTRQASADVDAVLASLRR